MFQAIIQTWKNVPNYCAISTKLEKMFQAIVQFPKLEKITKNLILDLILVHLAQILMDFTSTRC